MVQAIQVLRFHLLELEKVSVQFISNGRERGEYISSRRRTGPVEYLPDIISIRLSVRAISSRDTDSTQAAHAHE